MKSRKRRFIQAIVLFAALAIPLRLVAQHDLDRSNQKHHHYKLVDLDTFGGPQSWVFGWNEVPGIMSNAGAVVGGADTSASNPNYPNFNPFMGLPFMLNAIPDPFIQHAFQWHDGDITDLGVLPGGYNSFAQWISGNGTIVGASENGTIDPLTAWPEVRAVLWEEGQITDLGTFGGNESTALAVNDRGQVVGIASNTIPDPFSGFGTQGRAFLWQNGAKQDLGTLGTGTFAIATFVNKHGQVAGAAFTNTIINPITLLPNQDTFFWQDDGQGMQDIGTFGPGLSFPNAMNNRGQVVGQSDLPGGAGTHAFFWDSKKKVLTDLGTLGGSGSTAHWINDAGHVVGGASTPNDQSFHATLWKHGKITDLGTTAGDPCTLAQSINSEDQIVGYTWDCNGTALHAFLWEDGGPMVDLNTLIPPGSTLQLVMATSINDHGEIGGQGVTSNGDNHAFLLIPCDDKHSDGEGCDYTPVDATTVPQTQPVAHQASGLMLSPIVTQRTSRYRHIASSRNTGNGLADDLLDGVPSLKRPPPPIYGYCTLNTANNTLDGGCVGADLFRCVGKYNPAQCPPGKKAKAPTNFSCAIGQVIRIDGATRCQAH
jgi:probable HAF family extracellular repeat protein